MSNQWKTAIESLPSIFKYLLVIGAAIFIAFLFPEHVKFKYHFERGQTWQYEDLHAAFDFAIKKPEAEIEAERALLRAEFAPYYEVFPAVVDSQKAGFQKDFYQQLDSVREAGQFPDVLNRPQAYLNFGQFFLDRIYQRGIIQLDEEHREQDEDFEVNLVRGTTTQEQSVKPFFTPKEAREELSDTLFSSNLEEPEFLYPILENHLQPSILYNDTLTQRFQADLMDNISTSRGMVREGELIIPEDGNISEEAYQKLLSLREQYEKELVANKSRLTVFIGYFLITGLIIGVFVLYLARNAREVFTSLPNMIFIFLWLIGYSYLVYVVEELEVLSAYLIPFCIVPIVIKTFFNARLALFTHIVVVLIASFLTTLGYEFTFLQILVGVVVLLSNVDTRDWSQFFYSMLFIFLAYGLGFLGLSLIQEGDIQRVDWSMLTWFFLNVFLTLLAYPLIPLLERVFGFTSSITLLELSDMNRPLLRELAMKAPGTLQHSLQVANLAEEAARKVDANPLLVKVAALYHDIGKSIHPAYFIENQGAKNPHEDISDLESAKKIVGHVTEGVKMAKKFRLPKVLIDFIRTHHGTTRVEYFYRNYLKEHPEENVDESQFRYPGPRPRSKEEAILMMADSIEAACKSLKNPTAEDLDELVDKIISGKITQGQLERSTISFRELEQCKRVFKKTMKSVHHVRIEYPEEEKTASLEENPPEEEKEKKQSATEE